MKALFCDKCDGRVFIDRAYCFQGNVELFCITCGKRWELGRETTAAKIITKLEKRREMAFSGIDPVSILS